MKLNKILALTLGLAFSVGVTTGCAAQLWEEKINVVFKLEGKIVDVGYVTQYENYESPTVENKYIPTDFKFLGWTHLDVTELDYSDPVHFKTQYIGGGRMVHYMDVRDIAKNSTITLNALMLHKDDIPKEYHYAVVAWYDKVGNSGLNADIMADYEKITKEYLLSEGVSQEDVDSVVFRGYAGNVGPTTGQILYDDDVDIMIGWGSVDNITTTGSIPLDMLKQSEPLQITYDGTVKNRYLHRLTDTVGSIKLTEWILSDTSFNFFNK